MRKKIKPPLFEIQLLVISAFTISSLWVAIGIGAYLHAIFGWSNFDFFISMSTEILISSFIWINSGIYLKYLCMQAAKPTKHKEALQCLENL